MLRKAVNVFKNPLRKFFYTYVFTDDINELMETLAYSPDMMRWTAAKLYVCANSHKFKHFSHNSTADYEAVLITKKIKLKYSSTEILAFKHFLIALSFLLKRYNDKKLVQKPLYPDYISPHLFIDRYLPLIDDLFVLVSSVEEVGQNYTCNSTEKGKDSGDYAEHRSLLREDYYTLED